jgi:hypothetical protein
MDKEKYDLKAEQRGCKIVNYNIYHSKYKEDLYYAYLTIAEFTIMGIILLVLLARV